jgi:hypothetical protein
MKLTAFGKLFIALVALGVIGYIGWATENSATSCASWARSGAEGSATARWHKGGRTTDLTKDDFSEAHNGHG